jgi:integrase
VLTTVRFRPTTVHAGQTPISPEHAGALGLVGREWTPRELRQSFVSLLSDERVPLEVISRLVGHRSTTVTETVYRKQLRPVIEGGADAMDRIFPPAADLGS